MANARILLRPAPTVKARAPIADHLESTRVKYADAGRDARVKRASAFTQLTWLVGSLGGGSANSDGDNRSGHRRGSVPTTPLPRSPWQSARFAHRARAALPRGEGRLPTEQGRIRRPRARYEVRTVSRGRASRVAVVPTEEGCRCGPELNHVEGRHRPGESLEGQLPERLGVHEPVDRGQDARRRQDLARLRLAAETESKVRDGPDRAVVPATLEPDRADVALPWAIPMPRSGRGRAGASRGRSARCDRGWRAPCGSARSVGLGTGTGSLKKIIMPSPVKRSSVPSWARVSRPARAWYSCEDAHHLLGLGGLGEAE